MGESASLYDIKHFLHGRNSFEGDNDFLLLSRTLFHISLAMRIKGNKRDARFGSDAGERAWSVITLILQ